jgi:two-component system, OmpR family, response regulator
VNGPRVLIVEDDSELRSVLVRALSEEGFVPEAVATGTNALERVEAKPPDLLVIDVGLPDSDGRDVCQALRAQGIDAPILFLTARDSLPDRLSGFESGGDDYVTKPFALAEVCARLHALARRADADGAIEAAGLRLDPVSHAVTDGSTTEALTPTEFRLLARMLANSGEAVRRHDLVRAGWPHEAIVHANTLDAYIARLRRKLRGLNGAPTITTVRGVGYTIR